MIVSDASPLVSLSRVGHLQLFPALYHRILIPPAVRDDAMRQGVRAATIDGASWIGIRPPRDSAMVEQLRHVERLDLGESEAIVVAIELGMRLVVDERRGHRVAQVHGVAVFGTTRVVVDAVRAGFIAIDEVEPLLRRMAAADFWLSERIIRLTVAQARQ